MTCPKCGLEASDKFFEDAVWVYCCVPCQYSWEGGDNNNALEWARMDAEMSDW